MFAEKMNQYLHISTAKYDRCHKSHRKQATNTSDLPLNSSVNDDAQRYLLPVKIAKDIAFEMKKTKHVQLKNIFCL